MENIIFKKLMYGLIKGSSEPEVKVVIKELSLQISRLKIISEQLKFSKNIVHLDLHDINNSPGLAAKINLELDKIKALCQKQGIVLQLWQRRGDSEVCIFLEVPKKEAYSTASSSLTLNENSFFAGSDSSSSASSSLPSSAFSRQLSSSSSSSSSLSSRAISEVRIKEEPKEEKPQPSIEVWTDERLEQAFRFLRGNSSSTSNCMFLASDIIECLQTREFPKKPSRTRAPGIRDLSDKVMKEMVPIPGGAVAMVTNLITTVTNQCRLFPYPPIETTRDNRPYIKVEEVAYSCMNYKDANKSLLDEARERGGIAFGRISLFRAGPFINQPGHEIAYRANATTGIVSFFDLQGINRGVETEPFIFHNLTDVYRFVDSMAVVSNMFGNFCFYTVEGGTARPQPQLLPPISRNTANPASDDPEVVGQSGFFRRMNF